MGQMSFQSPRQSTAGTTLRRRGMAPFMPALSCHYQHTTLSASDYNNATQQLSLLTQITTATDKYQHLLNNLEVLVILLVPEVQ